MCEKTMCRVNPMKECVEGQCGSFKKSLQEVEEMSRKVNLNREEYINTVRAASWRWMANMVAQNIRFFAFIGELYDCYYYFPPGNESKIL